MPELFKNFILPRTDQRSVVLGAYRQALLGIWLAKGRWYLVRTAKLCLVAACRL
ncbi:MAG: hypothetical protein N3D16_10940 [Anaerolineales bacterium]|nr:hypothetical protein [Anaerolineales bacterium]